MDARAAITVCLADAIAEKHGDLTVAVQRDASGEILESHVGWSPIVGLYGGRYTIMVDSERHVSLAVDVHDDKVVLIVLTFGLNDEKLAYATERELRDMKYEDLRRTFELGDPGLVDGLVSEVGELHWFLLLCA